MTALSHIHLSHEMRVTFSPVPAGRLDEDTRIAVARVA